MRLNCFTSFSVLPRVLELRSVKKRLLFNAQCPWIIRNIIVESNFRRRNSNDSTCNTSKRSGYDRLLSVPIFLVNLR